MASDERVILNVGGSRFEVSIKTLSRFPSSLLGSLSDPENPHNLQKDSNGEYFFDRNGRFFEFILEYYRSGHISPPSDITSPQVVKELEFWMLDTSEYLQSLEDAAPSKQVRSYVEMFVDDPGSLELNNEEICERIRNLPSNERLKVADEFLHHTDHDLIRLSIDVLMDILNDIQADPSTVGSPFHLEVLNMTALGFYRFGKMQLTRKYLDEIFKYDPQNKVALTLQTLVNDTSTNYRKLGAFAIGLSLIGLAALKLVEWKRNSQSP